MADVSAGELTWNGSPLLAPDVYGEMEQFIRQFQTVEEAIAFLTDEPCQTQKTFSPKSGAGTGIAIPNFPDLPKPELNTLIWPSVGAGRFAYFFGLSDGEGNPEPGDLGSLVMNDGTNSQTIKMMVLGKKTIAGNVRLLMLVDQRYKWQNIDCGNIVTAAGREMMITSGDYDGTPNNDYGTGNIDFEDVVSACEEKIGISIDRDSFDGFYVADVLELSNKKFANVAVLLDAVADSVGMRIVATLDGGIHCWKADGHPYNVNFQNAMTNFVAGGSWEDYKDKPTCVKVNFPRATWNHSYPDCDVYTITDGDENNAIVVESTMYAHFKDTPDNGTNKPDNDAKLQDLASNLKTNLLGWWGTGVTSETDDDPKGGQYDYTWLGVKPWSCTGFDNYVEYKFCYEVPNDQYNIPIVSDDLPKADTKFDLNQLVFITRVQSMPHYYGTRINLSQDSEVRFLRGLQWGKVFKMPVKATTKNPEKPYEIEIWQYDSKQKEHNTKIKIQAWDVFGGSPKKDEKVFLWFHSVNRRWVLQKMSDELQIIEIDGSSGETQANEDCLFSSQIVTVDSQYGFCSDYPFGTNKAVWAAIFNNNTKSSPVRNLPAKERYLAKLAGLYKFSGGEEDDERPLYLIKEEEKTKVELVRVAGTKIGEPVYPNAQCIWPGQRFIRNNKNTPSWCGDDNYDVQENVWLTNLNTTPKGVAKKYLNAGQKYIGKYLGNFTIGSPSLPGNTRPLYAIRQGDEDNVRIVTINSSGTAKMQRKNSNCLYQAKVTLGNTNNSGCSTGFWEQQETCYVLTMNNDGEIINWMPNKDRYIGVYVGSLTDNEDTTKQIPIYAIRADHHLIRFQLMLPLVCGTAPPTNNAIELRWNGTGAYVPSTNDRISVIDYTVNGSFSGLGTNQLAKGYQGWAEWKPDRKVYEIVWMQQQANWIKFTNDSSDITPSTSNASVTVTEWWQGRNPDPNNAGVSVYNQKATGDGNYIFRCPRNAIGLAVWDELNNYYRIVWTQSKPQFITGKLTEDIASNEAEGTVTYAWGPERHITITTADLYDPAQIFTGKAQNKYQATYCCITDRYILTWVECSQGDEEE